MKQTNKMKTFLIKTHGNMTQKLIQELLPYAEVEEL